MKRFYKRILLFLLPFIIVAAYFLVIDVFRIYGYQDYYTDQKVELNRSAITTTTYNQFRLEENYNSFILGSSRSQAFKCSEWKNYLQSDARPFHFDGSGEGIWDISKKIEYIDKNGDSINNVLLVLDRTLLGVDSPRKGHLFIAMPCISGGSYYEFYGEFIKSLSSPKFVIAYIDYSIFKKHRNYMGYLIKDAKYDHSFTEKTCDIWYGLDKQIKEDSIGYYKDLKIRNVFYERPVENVQEFLLSQKAIAQLRFIKTIFDKHNTNYRIVMSPVYDQIPIENSTIDIISEIFGGEFLYDFSGKNSFTDSISNYYESSHYRPVVASKIMKIIYESCDSPS